MDDAGRVRHRPLIARAPKAPGSVRASMALITRTHLMQTLVDTAAQAGNFTTLIAALQTASFIDTLRTAGPYTLFAPTDAAFRRLVPGALDALLRDTGRLYTFLAHHVVSGIVMLKDVTSGNIKTLGGASLVAARADGNAFVNSVLISRADIAASNGVMHVVDQVILPFGEMLTAT
jgi:uncharacterized surface protein with fasciclin (FAS1) repeats